MPEWAQRWKWGIASVALLIAALVMWQVWPKYSSSDVPAAAPEPMPSAPVVVYGPEPLPRWAWDEIPWRLVRFTVPSGHWVYYSQTKREFLVVPGTPLHDGADAPDEDTLYAQAVAVFTEIHFDQSTFKSWEDTEYTMAEFLCARGTSEEDYVICPRQPSQDVTGVNPRGLPMHTFVYPKTAYQTKERIGHAPFTAVRLGANGTFGLLFYALDESRGRAPVRTVVQTLVRTVEDAAR